MIKPSCEYEYPVNLLMLRIAGLLPFESGSKTANTMITFCSVFSLLFVLLPAIYGVIFQWNHVHPDDRMNIFITQGEILFTLLKGNGKNGKLTITNSASNNYLPVCCMIPQRRRFSRLVRIGDRMWESVENRDEFRVIESTVKRGRYITYFFCADVLFVVINLLLAPVFSHPIYDDNGTMIRSRPLPYPAGLVHRNSTLYYLWFACQIPTGIVCAFCITGIDTAIFCFTSHGIAHMRAANLRFQRVFETRSDEQRSRRNFFHCVKYHQTILDYCWELENTFDHVMLLQTLLGMTITAIIGTNILRESTSKIQLVPYLCGAACQLLLICSLSENLANESSAVGETVYNLPWTSLPTRDWKLIEIMSMRCQKPTILIAGKFTVMSLSTVSKVTSQAMSFFTILRRTM